MPMSTPSGTPITDAEAMPWAAIYPTLPKINGDEVVPAIVARKLERDLAQARRELRDADVVLADYKSALASAQAENERLREELLLAQKALSNERERANDIGRQLGQEIEKNQSRFQQIASAQAEKAHLMVIYDSTVKLAQRYRERADSLARELETKTAALEKAKQHAKEWETTATNLLTRAERAEGI